MPVVGSLMIQDKLNYARFIAFLKLDKSYSSVCEGSDGLRIKLPKVNILFIFLL